MGPLLSTTTQRGGDMHDWSDKNFDWKSLDKAGNYLQKRCIQFARFGIHTKEKWGTLRVDTTVAFITEYEFIHALLYPGHCYYRLPRWFRKYIDRPFGKLMGILGIVGLLQRYQKATLKFFWKRAAKKWPHIAKEIMCDYEFITE